MHRIEDDPDRGLSERPPLADRFRLQKLLGSGTSGAVYQAFDEVRGALIAIKFLTALDPASLFRFKSEFRTLASLTHPNLLQLYELVVCQGDWLLTMELVEGTDFLTHVRPSSSDDLAETLEAPTNVVSTDTSSDARATLRARAISRSLPAVPSVCPFDEQHLRSALLQLCEGLHALHRADRLHRDLKPANVLVSTADGRVVICDFGLALESTQHHRTHDASTSEDPFVDGRFESRHREVAGTLAFMSPEQARAQTLTAASDWYSVGVMLYQALTGRVPFGRSLSYNSAVRAKLEAHPVHPAEFFPATPGELADLALAMLDPDPRRRAGYREALLVLEGRSRRSPQRVRLNHAFVGREAQLSQLARAFVASQNGSPSIALVSGLSGMGKSALVQHFLARIEDEEQAVVLRARCYEREQLPYKALDPLIDALSSHLLTLDRDDVAAVLPASAHFLAALFPALRRVPAIADLPTPTSAVTDPRERRRQAFRAFRELCQRLARQRPLVLFIDDLQWGDLDSAPLFQELLAPPDPPAVLVVCAHRKEDEQRSPLLSLLRATHALDASSFPLLDVPLAALDLTEATRLAFGMLQGTAGAEQAADLIAREAEGSPFFVRELAAYVREHGTEAISQIRLDALIEKQLDTLPRETREVLSVIAVAGRPIAPTTVMSVSGLGPATFKALGDLTARRLCVTIRADAEERVECCHDRIRETVCRLLTDTSVRTLHRALAEQLEADPLQDCDALLEHWRGAGEREKASTYAIAGAQKAETALAFSRAAVLYREALSLLLPHDSRERDLRERLGHALILAGRGPEAATELLALIEGASPAHALTLRTLATTQLLRGGKLVQGFHELARADDLFGVRFPESEAKAIAMLLTRQLRIRFKEHKIVVDAAQRAHDNRGQRLDALWEVAAAVASADFLRGGVYGAELMLRAIEIGDPTHIAAACGLEAINAAAAGDARRTQKMIDLAERAAEVTGSLLLGGRVRGMQAICRQLEGRWTASIRLARESQELQRRCARLTWDYAIMIWWEMASASLAGHVRELVAKIPEALRDAEERGDVYAATSFRTHRSSWAWLGMDRADLADVQVDIAEREWTPNGYQFQHWHMTYARSEIDLYRGTPSRSLERLTQEWKRGRLVRQVQAVRADMLYTRARLALSTARADYRPSLVAAAAADGRALIRIGAPWTTALGQLVLAGAASFDSPSEALRLLVDVESKFVAADMLMHVEVARARRGELVGGSEGRTLTETALERVRLLGVKRPERFVALLLPTASL